MKVYYWLAIACLVIALVDLSNVIGNSPLAVKVIGFVFFVIMMYGAIVNFKKGLKKK